MTAEDLARWDLSMITRSLLKPTSYDEMETEVRLRNGAGTRYGLGIEVTLENGRRVLKHGGEVCGFIAGNTVFPDDRAAIVVLTNQDAVDSDGMITKGIEKAILDVEDPETPKKLTQAQAIFADLQRGALDRSMFTDNALSYFDDAARKDIQQGLAPLGRPRSFIQTRKIMRGGMIGRRFLVTFKKRQVTISTYEMPDGKLEQYMVSPEEP